MKTIVAGCVLLGVVLGLQAQEKSKTPCSLGLDLGYRQDRGQWTISGGEEGPNIISDLEWEDLQIIELRFYGDVKFKRVVFDGSLAFGAMYDGDNRDSDYAYDNREGEFSRSYADTDGDTFDLSLAVGVPFTVSESGIVLTPRLGYSLNEQNHSDTNGFQAIDDPALEAELDGGGPAGEPFLGEFDGLDSTYDASWSGVFLGLDAVFPVGENGRFVGRYQFHVFEYSAELYWNLRDLDFENEADGIGHHFSLAYLHRVTGNMHLRLEGALTAYESDDGIQTDPEGDIDLNGAEWESLALRFGVVGIW